MSKISQNRPFRKGNPAKQGLKLLMLRLLILPVQFRKGNPAKQGLKRFVTKTWNPLEGESEKEIQQNKD